MTDAAADVPDVVRRGSTLFNRGKYFDAQQVFEDGWQIATGADRPFLEGLVQLAAGLHLRTERGGLRGAEHLMSQGLATLEDFRPATHGLDVEALVNEFGVYVDWVREIRRPHGFLDWRRIPKLRVTG